jgi:MerR family redox-sensitive transcriptional activator SoxR
MSGVDGVRLCRDVVGPHDVTVPVQVDLKSRDDAEAISRNDAGKTTRASPGTLTIGEVAAATQLSTSAIRYYESRGLIAPCGRVSGHRRFEPSVVRRLWLINICTQAGFSLAECLTLLTDREGSREESRRLGSRKLAEIDEHIEQLSAARRLIEVGMACTCPTLEDCSCSADIENALPAPLRCPPPPPLD